MMAMLYVLDVPEFAPLVSFAEERGLQVARAPGYIRISASPRLEIARMPTGLGKAVWFGALTGGFTGEISRFDDDMLVLDDA